MMENPFDVVVIEVYNSEIPLLHVCSFSECYPARKGSEILSAGDESVDDDQFQCRGRRRRGQRWPREEAAIVVSEIE